MEKFQLGVLLPNVSDEDSLYYRIEALRVYLEKQLGADTFLQAYRFLKAMEDQEDSDESSEQLTAILKDKLGYLSLLNQLLFCEDQLEHLGQ
jgi:hypothetical protein